MKWNGFLTTTAIGSLCLGCALSQGHQRVMIPLADRVTRIIVARSNADQPANGLPDPKFPVIEDRERINQTIRFLSKHSGDWKTPPETFPASEYALQIETEGGKHLIVWLGQDWVGGAVGNANQLQRINVKEMQKLREILEIPAKRPNLIQPDQAGS